MSPLNPRYVSVAARAQVSKQAPDRRRRPDLPRDGRLAKFFAPQWRPNVGSYPLPWRVVYLAVDERFSAFFVTPMNRAAAEVALPRPVDALEAGSRSLALDIGGWRYDKLWVHDSQIGRWGPVAASEDYGLSSDGAMPWPDVRTVLAGLETRYPWQATYLALDERFSTLSVSAPESAAIRIPDRPANADDAGRVALQLEFRAWGIADRVSVYDAKLRDWRLLARRQNIGTAASGTVRR